MRGSGSWGPAPAGLSAEMYAQRFEHAEAFRDEQDRLAARQVLRSLDDQVDGAECAGRHGLRAREVERAEIRGIESRRRVRVENFELVDGRKRLDGGARERVPLQVLDRGVQHAAIGRERLQPVHRPARADERDEIAGLHRFVDEVVQAALGVMEAFDREAQIIDDDRDGALDVLAAHGRVRQGRRADHVVRFQCRGGRRPLRRNEHRHVLGERHLLRLAVLKDLEVVRREVAHDLAVLVGDDRVDAHGINRDAKSRRLRFLRGEHRVPKPKPDRAPQDCAPHR